MPDGSGSAARATGAVGVAVIGSGAWGTTLALLAATAATSAAADATPATAATSAPPSTAPAPERAAVMLWEHRTERAATMARLRENSVFLPGHRFPDCLGVTSDLAAAVAGRAIVVLVTPAQRVRENARLLAPHLAPGAVVVCASKGLELGTFRRMTEVARAELGPAVPVAALSGPNLAGEIARGMPAAAVIAAADDEVAERARQALATSRFRLYTTHDVIGVELGGALKNIIALGVGISDGLGYGDNAKASIMTRGLAEMARLATAAGANALTLSGLAGLGDLIATCSSALSRNHTLGLELAKGRALDDVLGERQSVAEGVPTTRAALEMARALDVELPITAQIAKVLFEGKDARQVVNEFMERDPKRELEGLRTE